MVPCVCSLAFLIIAGALLIGIELPKLVLFTLGVSTCAVLYVLIFAINSLRRAEIRPAAEAAVKLFEERNGKTPDLPDKLRGVFWFGTNKAPELLWTLEGEEFDADKRRIILRSGGPYNWTYSTGLLGWLYWAALRLSYLFCAKLHINFEDEDLTSARLPVYLCNCIWAPMGMLWELRQIDENTWDRPIYLYCMPWQRWEFGSYVFKRIIDQDGNKLPAFGEMVHSVEEGFEGYPRKPELQIMNGESGCFDFLSADSDSYREL